MFNKSKKAINNLNNLLLELENISNVQQGNNWKAKLKDALNLYIGENSSLSQRLDKLHFTRIKTKIVPGVIGIFKEHIYEPSNKSNFRDLINNAISHIKANGISNSVKKNFFVGFNNTEIISGIVIAVGIVYGIGNYLGKLEKDREFIKYENKIENLKKNIEIIKNENEKLNNVMNSQQNKNIQLKKEMLNLRDSVRNVINKKN